MTEKAKLNAERRKQREAEAIRERQLIHDTLVSVLEDSEATNEERLKAAELLQDELHKYF